MQLNEVSRDKTFQSVTDFVNAVKGLYGLSESQQLGFVSFMKQKNKFYLFSQKEFIPYLREYLGKK